MKKIIIGYIAIASFSFSFAFAQDLIFTCKNIFAQDQTECDAAERWASEDFTQPEKLENAKQFQVVFHSITGYNWDSSKKRLKRNSWNDQLLKDPTLISNNPKISASLISNQRPGTFLGRIGFILEVHPENMVATHTSDANSPRIKNYEERNLQVLIDYSKQKLFDIRSPEYILENTAIYNELILTGTARNGQTVKPIGVIIRCDSDKMISLNNFSDFEFGRYLIKNCTEFHRNVIKKLIKLRGKYPMFGYPLEGIDDEY